MPAPRTATRDKPRLILASASPRRLELLRQIGIEPDAVVPAEIDERAHPGEKPGEMAARLAEAKARAGGRNCSRVQSAGDKYPGAGRRYRGRVRPACPAQGRGRGRSAARSRPALGAPASGLWGRLRDRRRRPGAPPLGGYGGRLQAARRRRNRRLHRHRRMARQGGSVRHPGPAPPGSRANVNGSYSNVVGLPLFETPGAVARPRSRPGGRQRRTRNVIGGGHGTRF